jgi:hypothetical protein
MLALPSTGGPKGVTRKYYKVQAAPGGRPLLHQTAVAETYSTARVCPPYHSAIVTFVQTVLGSASTALSLGRVCPSVRAYPVCSAGVWGWFK